ncbi:amine sulfotransferase-like isoform X1 [Brachionichthys hirsutus]|uniref:amine sulfotransferase-like isoform X1 n=1 Tax=Brachionichthys hirsutus TaxID=412623 RepID=UPI0036048133
MDSLDLVSPYLFRYKNMNFLLKEKLRAKDIDALLDFEIRPTDIFLITYPKSGTIWMQQILAEIIGAVKPDWLEDVTNRTQIPMLEGGVLGDPFRPRPDPRVFRSHLYPDMLPHGVKNKQVKVVYVWRNPKDVLVSMYHFARSFVLLETPESFADFFQQFLDGDVLGGSWFDHVKKGHEAQTYLDIHFVQYENMLKDLRQEVVELCAFLGADLTDEVIDRVVEKSTFKNMKTDPKGNYKDLSETHIYKEPTMRKGVAGDWKNHFTVAQNERFDKVFKEKMSSFPLTCTWAVKE